LNDFFKHASPVLLEENYEHWMSFPSEDFLSFCSSYPNENFLGVPPSENYIKQPNFFICQAHRIFITTLIVNDLISKNSLYSFLDIGSYPFSVPLTLRDFYQFDGTIHATRNLTPPEGTIDFLHSKKINSPLLELDPLIVDPNAKTLPSKLEFDEDSIDCVLFSHVFEHLYHPVIALKECFRVLKPGGFLVLSTDNAMMIETLLNFIKNSGFIHEDIRGTSAMDFGFWRGHVRFYTENDIVTLLHSIGFDTLKTSFYQICYNAFYDGYFKEKNRVSLPQWHYNLIREHPQFRNDIFVIAHKRL